MRKDQEPKGYKPTIRYRLALFFGVGSALLLGACSTAEATEKPIPAPKPTSTPESSEIKPTATPESLEEVPFPENPQPEGTSPTVICKAIEKGKERYYRVYMELYDPRGPQIYAQRADESSHLFMPVLPGDKPDHDYVPTEVFGLGTELMVENEIVDILFADCLVREGEAEEFRNFILKLIAPRIDPTPESDKPLIGFDGKPAKFGYSSIVGKGNKNQFSGLRNSNSAWGNTKPRGRRAANYGKRIV